MNATTALTSASTLDEQIVIEYKSWIGAPCNPPMRVTSNELNVIGLLGMRRRNISAEIARRRQKDINLRIKLRKREAKPTAGRPNRPRFADCIYQLRCGRRDYAQLAREFGYKSRSHVRKLCMSLGLDVAVQRVKIDEVKVAIMADIESGMINFAEVSRKYNVSRHSVRRLVIRKNPDLYEKLKTRQLKLKVMSGKQPGNISA